MEIEQKLEDGFAIDYQSILNRDLGERIDYAALISQHSSEAHLRDTHTGGYEKLSAILYRKNKQRK